MEEQKENTNTETNKSSFSFKSLSFKTIAMYAAIAGCIIMLFGGSTAMEIGRIFLGLGLVVFTAFTFLGNYIPGN